jgi:hypothetical protein
LFSAVGAANGKPTITHLEPPSLWLVPEGLFIDFGPEVGGMVEPTPDDATGYSCAEFFGTVAVAIERCKDAAQLSRSRASLVTVLMAPALAMAGELGLGGVMGFAPAATAARADDSLTAYLKVVDQAVRGGTLGQSERVVRELASAESPGSSAGAGPALGTDAERMDSALRGLRDALAQLSLAPLESRRAGMAEDAATDELLALAHAVGVPPDDISSNVVAGFDDDGGGAIAGAAAVQADERSVVAAALPQPELSPPAVVPMSSAALTTATSAVAAAPGFRRAGPSKLPPWLLGQAQAQAAGKSARHAAESAASEAIHGKALAADESAYAAAVGGEVGNRQQQLLALLEAGGENLVVQPAPLVQPAGSSSSGAKRLASDSRTDASEHGSRIDVPVDDIVGPLRGPCAAYAQGTAGLADVTRQAAELAAAAGCDMGRLRGEKVPGTHVALGQCIDGVAAIARSPGCIAVTPVYNLPADANAAPPGPFHQAMDACDSGVLQPARCDRVFNPCAYTARHGKIRALPAKAGSPLFVLSVLEGAHVVLLQKLPSGKFEVILPSNIAASVAPNGQPWLVYTSSDGGVAGPRAFDQDLRTILSAASRSAEQGRRDVRFACRHYSYATNSLTCECVLTASARYCIVFSHNVRQDTPYVISQSGFIRPADIGNSSMSSRAAARAITGLAAAMMVPAAAVSSRVSAVEHQRASQAYRVTDSHDPSSSVAPAFAAYPGALSASAAAPAPATTYNVSRLLPRISGRSLPCFNSLRRHAEGREYTDPMLMAVDGCGLGELAVAGTMVYPALPPLAQNAVALWAAAHAVCSAVERATAASRSQRPETAERLRSLQEELSRIGMTMLAKLGPFGGAGEAAPSRGGPRSAGASRSAPVVETSGSAGAGSGMGGDAAATSDDSGFHAGASSPAAPCGREAAQEPLAGAELVQRGLDAACRDGVRGIITVVVITDCASPVKLDDDGGDGSGPGPLHGSAAGAGAGAGAGSAASGLEGGGAGGGRGSRRSATGRFAAAHGVGSGQPDTMSKQVREADRTGHAVGQQAADAAFIHLLAQDSNVVNAATKEGAACLASRTRRAERIYCELIDPALLGALAVFRYSADGRHSAKLLAASHGSPARKARLVLLVPEAALDPAIGGSGLARVFAVLPSGDVFILPIALSNPMELSSHHAARPSAAGVANSTTTAGGGSSSATAASGLAAGAGRPGAAAGAAPAALKLRWALVDARVLPLPKHLLRLIDHLICLVVLLAPLHEFYLVAPAAPLHPNIYGSLVYVAWNGLVEHWRRAMHGYLPCPAVAALARAMLNAGSAASADSRAESCLGAAGAAARAGAGGGVGGPDGGSAAGGASNGADGDGFAAATDEGRVT